MTVNIYTVTRVDMQDPSDFCTLVFTSERQARQHVKEMTDIPVDQVIVGESMGLAGGIWYNDLELLENDEPNGPEILVRIDMHILAGAVFQR